MADHEATTTLRGRVLPRPGEPQELDAVHIAGERIAAAKSDGGRVLDFGGRTVLPGFIDPHVHSEHLARADHMADCRAPNCASVDDVLQALSDNLDKARDGWLVGMGNLFLDQKLADGRLPSREELDSVSKDLCIALRAGGHTSVLNSKAFEISDVVRYAGKEGMMGSAVIETGPDGNPSGTISELDAALPIPPLDEGEVKRAIRRVHTELFRNLGVTSLGEISESIVGMHAMDSLFRAGETHTRTSLYLWTPATMSIDDACRWQDILSFESPKDRLVVQGLKVFADGGYSARNAATLTPYREPYAVCAGSCGHLNLDSEAVAVVARRAEEAGLQLAVHANGERAQHAACDGIREHQGGDGTIPPTRVEHAGNLVTTQDTIDHWRQASILPAPNPAFLYVFGDVFSQYLGPPATTGRFPFRRLLDDGWRISGGSDIGMGCDPRQTNPMFGIWCCVHREGFEGGLIEPDQRISVDEALRMFTLNGAHALGVEDERGSLEPGKLADVIVLDRDPREVESSELLDVNVDYVFVGGELVHERPGAEPYRQEGQG
jgi:predicted amidohydrolase YtcJ